MDEMNKLSEEQNHEDLLEQDFIIPNSVETSEFSSETPPPKATVPKLPLIISGVAAAVAVLALVLVLILSGGKHEHRFGDWNIVDEPTCLAVGFEERVCECGDKEMRRVEALGHTEVVDSAVNPTCTSTGLTEGKHCSSCGIVIVKQETVAHLTHKYSSDLDIDCNNCGDIRVTDCAHIVTEVIPGKISTCTASGLTDGTKCQNCGKIIVVQTSIPMAAHTEITGLAVEATCAAPGLTAGTKCSVCGITLVAQQETPKVAHIYDDKYDDSCNECGYIRDTECAHKETEIIKGYEETCTSSGLTDGEKCKKCDEILVTQVYVAAKSHAEVTDAAVEPTCTSTGLTEGKHCSACFKVLVAQSIVSKLAHTEIIDSAVAATCTSSGLTEGSHCGVCGIIIVEQRSISMKGHSEIKLDAVKSTCTTDGLTEGCYCPECDTVLLEQMVIPSRHTYGEWITDSVPTCKTSGYKHQICSVCGETINRLETGSLGHSYENNLCVLCGITQPGLYDTEGNLLASWLDLLSYGFRMDIWSYYEQKTLFNIINKYPVLASGVKLVIDDDVVCITMGAFENCTSLKIVEIPESVITIGDCAFLGCTALEKIVIPVSVTTIGQGSFNRCVALRSVIFAKGSKIQEFGQAAFNFCISLDSIVLPASVKKIGDDAFAHCTKLSNFRFEGTVEQWKEVVKGIAWRSSVPATEIVCSNGTVSFIYMYQNAKSVYLNGGRSYFFTGGKYENISN